MIHFLLFFFLNSVPPLKFGSLVDSKQHSDDEDTTMVTPSVPTDGPRIPLNGKVTTPKRGDNRSPQLDNFQFLFT